ncbi:hypothetical protein SELMODRAFT_432186 [Selaginella moellendorffii]|uniref:Uncharacterized protein n=1 Tax=Selaginella moellendorffii TaxID=88036 RepID=D8TF88_SELML|nr:hypothetical protein SELMODRAFT_432186 [Selaginella moellendorffii]
MGKSFKNSFLSINRNEDDPFDDSPDEDNVPHTGNNGGGVSSFYHTTALVVWPKDCRMEALCYTQSSESVVKWLEEQHKCEPGRTNGDLERSLTSKVGWQFKDIQGKVFYSTSKPGRMGNGCHWRPSVSKTKELGEVDKGGKQALEEGRNQEGVQLLPSVSLLVSLIDSRIPYNTHPLQSPLHLI